MTLYYFMFQPFGSRVGKDKVISLRLDRYDPQVVKDLKAAIDKAQRILRKKNQGGWLPDHKCWFIESAAWDVVEDEMCKKGHDFMSENG